jgi:hypothetical protein
VSNDCMIVNINLERIWMEEVLAHFEALLPYLIRRREENYGNL